MALDPEQPNRVYVWVVGHGLLTRDAPGERWQQLAPASSLGDVRALAVHPLDHEKLYAATATGVWVSSDGGRRWEQPADGLRKSAAGLAIVPGAPEVVLAATEDGIFVGDITGRRWRLSGAAPQWWGPLVELIAEPATRSVIALSHEGMVAHRGLDGGDWRSLSEALSSRRAARQE